MRALVLSSIVLLVVGSCRPEPPEPGDAPPRAASISEAAQSEAPGPVEAPDLAEMPPPEVSRVGRGPFGALDGAVLGSLRAGAPAAVEKGRGGRSLSFKITLEDGTAGYFKPEQSFSAAHFDSEIAAFCLDRALGFGRTAPVTGRVFPWVALARAAAGDARTSELAIDASGELRGAFVAWIDGDLPRFDPGRGFERALRLERAPRVNPYQAPVDVRRSANLEERPDAEIHDRARPVADLSPERVAELSDLIVFDYLVQNVDRWGGGFTNLRLAGQSGPLIFLDNGAGFWPGEQRLSLLERRLVSLQRFRRETVDALRAFDAARFEACLDADPLAPVLDPRRRAGLRERVGALVEALAALEARLGDAIYIEAEGML